MRALYFMLQVGINGTILVSSICSSFVLMYSSLENLSACIILAGHIICQKPIPLLRKLPLVYLEFQQKGHTVSSSLVNALGDLLRTICPYEPTYRTKVLNPLERRSPSHV